MSKKMFLKYCKKVVFYLAYLIFIFTLLEIGSKTALTVRGGVPFFNPKEIVYKFYPELKQVKQEQIKKGDEYFNILFLGGSVLNRRWSSIEQTLQKKLENKTKRKIRIHNLAQACYTSLDSHFKYRHLLDRDFDLVVFYHGLNEVRANNCPPEIFKADYSHSTWYESISIIEKHKEIDFITFLFLAHQRFISIKQKLNSSKYVPVDHVKKEWIEEGVNIKTENSFRKNLTEILEIAKRKKAPVLLMTYALYIPENYSLKKFKDKSLDYGTHECPVESIGKPENVIKGTDAHNKIIKDIATQRRIQLFVDQDRLIPKNGYYFNDFCHFADKGSEKFVDNILGLIIKSTNSGS